MIFSLGLIQAQDIDTFFLKYGVSKYDMIIYKRIIEFDKNSKIYHVKDYFENGLTNGLSTTHRKQQLPASTAIVMC